MLTDVQAAWLAGLLEGEGCFRVRHDGSKKWRPRISVTLKMSDRDVVDKAAQLLPGSPRKVRVCEDSKKNPKWSDTYECGWYGQAAEDLMVTVLPYMGQRRSAKIRECLATPTLSHTESTPTERE